MSKQEKIFLPRWIRWVIYPVLGLLWGFITYTEFASPQGQEEIGMIGWLVITAVFVLIGIMFWLQTSGKLPAYIIVREDDTDTEP